MLEVICPRRPIAHRASHLIAFFNGPCGVKSFLRICPRRARCRRTGEIRSGGTSSWFCCMFSTMGNAAPSARTRAGDHGHPLVCARRACCVSYDRSLSWLGNPSGPLAVADWTSKLTGVLSYVLHCMQYRKHRARKRARVTMVTRLCAGVEHSVLFRTEQTPCLCLGAQVNP